MIWLFPTQLVEGLITRIDALKIQIYGIKDVIVSDTTLNDVILLMRQSLAASSHVVKPFAIVGRKHFAINTSNIVRKFIYIHNGWFATTNESLTIVTCLLLKRCEIHAIAKVQMVARMVHVWL